MIKIFQKIVTIFIIMQIFILFTPCLVKAYADAYSVNEYNYNKSMQYQSYISLDDDEPEYIFRVRSMKNSREWEGVTTSIKTIPVTSFWETWWFRMLSVFFAAELVYVWHRLRISNLERQRRELKHLISQNEENLSKIKNKLHVETIEHRIAEQELKEANKRLSELDKMKSDFLSMVSHELKTPLTSILGFSKLLDKKINNVILMDRGEKDFNQIKTAAQVERDVSIIIKEGERLNTLINQMLSVIEMDKGEVCLKTSIFSPVKIVEDSLIELIPLINDKGLKVIKEFEENLPEISGDRDKLLQVVNNLISNAVKFTEKGCMTCSVKKDGNCVIISVTDTGRGIEEKDFDKIFEKFIQGGNILTDKPQGMGIGLWMCRHIVEQNGGKIWISSEIHKGSCFSFSIPIRL